VTAVTRALAAASSLSSPGTVASQLRARRLPSPCAMVYVPGTSRVRSPALFLVHDRARSLQLVQIANREFALADARARRVSAFDPRLGARTSSRTDTRQISWSAGLFFVGLHVGPHVLAVVTLCDLCLLQVFRVPIPTRFVPFTNLTILSEICMYIHWSISRMLSGVPMVKHRRDAIVGANRHKRVVRLAPRSVVGVERCYSDCAAVSQCLDEKKTKVHE
jgi:hypothetical protein